MEEEEDIAEPLEKRQWGGGKKLRWFRIEKKIERKSWDLMA